MKIDTSAPTTTISAADDLWHNSPVTLTLLAVDNDGGSGMSGGSAKSEYKLDSGEWTSGASLTVSSEGVHTVGYRSTDAAGNTETAKSATVKIDTSAPTTTISGADDLWHNSPVTLTLSRPVSTTMAVRA